MKKCICIILSLIALFMSGCGAEVAFVSGKFSNNVYESKFASLRFAPGPAWKFDSAEEIAEYNATSNGTENADDITKLHSIRDMYAEDPASGTRVCVTFENFGSYVGISEMTEDEYVASLLKIYNDGTDVYESEASDGGTVVIGNNEYRRVEVTLKPASGSSSAFNMYYYVRKIGKFMLSVSVSVVDGASDESAVLSLFDAPRD